MTPCETVKSLIGIMSHSVGKTVLHDERSIEAFGSYIRTRCGESSRIGNKEFKTLCDRKGMRSHKYKKVVENARKLIQVPRHKLNPIRYLFSLRKVDISPGRVADILGGCGLPDPGSSPGRGTFVLSFMHKELFN